ncbi:MAG TPA: M15 family metallopeptidase [Bacteroidales bacterium]|nr:M15 family metallopeptidase [Bacteroidales bacterium]
MMTINSGMNVFKGSGIFIAISLLLLCTYYFFIHKSKKDINSSASNISIVDDTIKEKPGAGAGKTDSTVSVEFLTGKFDPVKDSSFTECDPEYASRSGIFIKKETYKAFIKMFYAAKNDGVALKIVSGTRNFRYQKSIWEQKWNGGRTVEGKNLAQAVKDPAERAGIILKYSSMPGTSRHHWGTDVDLNSIDPGYFETAAGKKVYDWLRNNASTYGFCQPFSAKGEKRKNGYEEEKWHWSYLPLARIYLKEYRAKISYENISGFAGSQTASQLDVINNYVLSISSDCE